MTCTLAWWEEAQLAYVMVPETIVLFVTLWGIYLYRLARKNPLLNAFMPTKKKIVNPVDPNVVPEVTTGIPEKDLDLPPPPTKDTLLPPGFS